MYLHGRFDDRDPDGRHLVMTSADFGTAYLTERWASRFVSELFAHFTVLFIGYSVNDPVMRYLVDAIAAERESGRDITQAYAFVGADATADLSDLRFEWSRKNVAPIPYTVTRTADGKPDHGLLHGTLRKWAELYEGGLESRKNVAYELGTKDPRGLSAEDKSRFLWAIEDPDVMAHLADMGTETSLGWIYLLMTTSRRVPYANRMLWRWSGGEGRVRLPLRWVDYPPSLLVGCPPTFRTLTS